MKTTYIYTYRAYDEYHIDFRDYPEILIVEVQDLNENEKRQLEEKNILYRVRDNKFEIFFFNYRTFLIEYDTKEKEGIYFEKTKLYYDYFEVEYNTEEIEEDDTYIVISKEGTKIEILNSVYKEDKEIFKKYFLGENTLF